MKIKEMFETRVSRKYEKLRDFNSPEASGLFENISFSLDLEKEFKTFKESTWYYPIISLSENESKQMELIDRYFDTNIIYPIIESVYNKSIENKELSMSKQMLIENAYVEYLEKTYFSTPIGKEFYAVFESLIDDYISFYESNNIDVFEESIIETVADNIGKAIKTLTEAFRVPLILVKILFLTITGPLISKNIWLHKNQYGTWSPFTYLLRFVVKDAKDIGRTLQKLNLADNTEIKDFIKEYTGSYDSYSKMITKCWNEQHVHLRPGEAPFIDLINKSINLLKKGEHAVSNPIYHDDEWLTTMFNLQASDQYSQKVYFEFRKCFYNRLINMIMGIAKTALELDATDRDILNKMKVIAGAPKIDTRKYEEFMRIKPKNESSQILFVALRVLISIKMIMQDADMKKDKLWNDKYLKELVFYVNQRIKQGIQELDEVSRRNQESSYNKDNKDNPRYNKDKDDRESDKKEPKESIFSL